ncbi:MAG: hypothetical protein A2Z66_05390 [Chloroflexi bacterium RBG_13_66_10]|nr:MAG: hypothetical protein A2Z66_05390 [Chloroflexi bacterium RBG_13_66_10]
MSAQAVKVSPSRSAKVTIGLIVAALIVGLVLTILAMRSSGLADDPGFLGTGASLLADLNLLAALLILGGLLIGFAAARSKSVAAHQYIQTAMVLLFLVLIVFIMEVSYWENVNPGIPERIGEASYAMPAVHAAIGGVAEVCGLYLVLLMNGWMPKALRVRKWKTLMRVTLTLFILVGVLGVATYYVWYILP